MALPSFMVDQMLKKAEPFIEKAAEKIIGICASSTYFNSEPRSRSMLVMEITSVIENAIRGFAGGEDGDGD